MDISVAVATPKGLVVPVVRNVESKNFADIEIAIAALGEKAKRNAIAVEDMDGGTFTISNGGVFGSLLGTPIINPPQSAILGMHGIFERPVAIKGQVRLLFDWIDFSLKTTYGWQMLLFYPNRLNICNIIFLANFFR